MVKYRSWRAGTMTFTVPYFDELLPENGGVMPKDVEAHALWHYFMIAVAAWEKEKTQPIYEGDTDAKFNAQPVFLAIANMHGVSPDAMLNYWSAVEGQAMLLGSERYALPPRFKFNRRSVN